MKTLFKGIIFIEYSQFYIQTKDPEDYDDFQRCFEGQENGLIGAVIPNSYFLTAGVQNGPINLTLKLYKSEPKVNRSYEDIVEVSITRGKDRLQLEEWGGGDTHKLDISEGTYRLRYSINGMDKNYNDNGEADDLDDDHKYWNSPLKGQKHFIQLWPDMLRKDAILKESSKKAKYWHDNSGRSIKRFQV